MRTQLFKIEYILFIVVIKYRNISFQENCILSLSQLFVKYFEYIHLNKSIIRLVQKIRRFIKRCFLNRDLSI